MAAHLPLTNQITPVSEREQTRKLARRFSRVGSDAPYSEVSLEVWENVVLPQGCERPSIEEPPRNRLVIQSNHVPVRDSEATETRSY
jgi:hypothetical protein